MTDEAATVNELVRRYHAETHPQIRFGLALAISIIMDEAGENIIQALEAGWGVEER